MAKKNSVIAIFFLLVLPFFYKSVQGQLITSMPLSGKKIDCPADFYGIWQIKSLYPPPDYDDFYNERKNGDYILVKKINEQDFYFQVFISGEKGIYISFLYRGFFTKIEDKLFINLLNETDYFEGGPHLDTLNDCLIEKVSFGLNYFKVDEIVRPRKEIKSSDELMDFFLKNFKNSYFYCKRGVNIWTQPEKLLIKLIDGEPIEKTFQKAEEDWLLF